VALQRALLQNLVHWDSDVSHLLLRSVVDSPYSTCRSMDAQKGTKQQADCQTESPQDMHVKRKVNYLHASAIRPLKSLVTKLPLMPSTMYETSLSGHFSRSRSFIQIANGVARKPPWVCPRTREAPKHRILSEGVISSMGELCNSVYRGIAELSTRTQIWSTLQ
jgi:hypothetical protein